MRRNYYSNAAKRTTKANNFDSAKNILEKALQKYGLEKKISRYKFVTHWPEIMGAAISQRTRPEYIKKNTLYIRVTDPAWAQELSFQKPIIIKRLQRFLNNEIEVQDIRFFVGEIAD